MFAELPRKYSLKEIANFLKTESRQDVSVSSVTVDSRKVKKGSLFIALQGVEQDGHEYISQAVENGASLIISQKKIALNCENLVVADTRDIFPELINFLFSNSSEKLKVIGVTGTNGKTTVNWLLYNALEILGKKVLRAGTLGIYAKNIIDKDSLTTPDLIELQSLFNEAINNGFEYAVLEVSSHALDQGRVEGVNFDSAIYTNLTQDHFDYHENFKNYYEAKKKLFTLLESSKKKNKTAVINNDCLYGKQLCEEVTGVEKITYALDGSDINGEIIKQSIDSFVYKISYKDKQYEFSSHIVGDYNLYNFMSVFACLVSLGFKEEDIINTFSKIPLVPGRAEPYNYNGVGVIIDYAHTPDALINVLKSVKAMTQKNLWVVFGCGGDRDKTKRALMGKAASENADRVVVTSDNPRTENPLSIINDILNDCEADKVEEDREQAIRYAMREARQGDVIVIAGKGHEDYQEIGTEKVAYSDQNVVNSLINS